jgi:hypothetical protein
VALYSGDLMVLTDDLSTVVAQVSCQRRPCLTAPSQLTVNHGCALQTNVSKMWIQTMAYAPDGKTLAVGSHDGSIYLLSAVNYSRRYRARLAINILRATGG